MGQFLLLALEAHSAEWAERLVYMLAGAGSTMIGGAIGIFLWDTFTDLGQRWKRRRGR